MFSQSNHFFCLSWLLPTFGYLGWAILGKPGMITLDRHLCSRYACVWSDVTLLLFAVSTASEILREVLQPSGADGDCRRGLEKMEGTRLGHSTGKAPQVCEQLYSIWVPGSHSQGTKLTEMLQLYWKQRQGLNESMLLSMWKRDLI